MADTFYKMQMPSFAKNKENKMSEWITSPESSTVAGFGYDEAAQVLTVEFNSGICYGYYGVPAHVFAGMKSAGSKGGYFNAQIKGIYEYARQ